MTVNYGMKSLYSHFHHFKFSYRTKSKQLNNTNGSEVDGIPNNLKLKRFKYAEWFNETETHNVL